MIVYASLCWSISWPEKSTAGHGKYEFVPEISRYTVMLLFPNHDLAQLTDHENLVAVLASVTLEVPELHRELTPSVQESSVCVC